jgi:urease accessory protein UreE
MIMETHLAFSLPRGSVRTRILIPKYYDPDLDLAIKRAEDHSDLPKLGDLLLPGDAGSQLGHWIGREYYGTGSIPYVRTSDLSHWRIRPDYKKGVSEEVYEQYRDQQDIRSGDILMVAHGTYLVGNVALVTEEDEKLVLQDHVFRLRVREQAGIDPHYLIAALSTSFVRVQVRARQFSADIIDKLGNRHLEIRVPILRDQDKRKAVASMVRDVINDQTETRRQFRLATGSDLRMTRERAQARYAFSIPREEIRSRILIPKYYDPEITKELKAIQAADSSPWVSLQNLVDAGILSIGTGVEVGKMAYGTGDIPFIRTSDIADNQIKLEVRHGINQEYYEAYEENASVKPEDVLVVRDGTYLVGSSAIVTENDVPALFCGGLYRLRSLDKDYVSPYWLLAV